MILSAICLVKPAGPIWSASYTVAMPPRATWRMMRNWPAYSKRRPSLSIADSGLRVDFDGRASRAFPDAARPEGPYDHRRRPYGAVRALLRWHARRHGANRGRARPARRPARGAVPREAHLRRRRLSGSARQGPGALTGA